MVAKALVFGAKRQKSSFANQARTSCV